MAPAGRAAPCGRRSPMPEWRMTVLLPRALRRAGQSLLDALYPRGCSGCETLLQASGQGVEAWLCADCRAALTPIETPFCAVCGEAFDGVQTEAFRCWNCEGRRLAFDFARSACKSAGPVRDMIHAFKYRRDLAQRAPLAGLMQPVFADPRLAGLNPSHWRLVPVPLHPLRRLWRGYNQSFELCRQLARATGIAVAPVLRRTRLTRPQAGLDRTRRLDNLRGIFALRPVLPWRPPPLAGLNVLLVDDVLTTGATAHECARVLKKQAGVEKVVVITAARG
jgi:competence protein ComFC